MITKKEFDRLLEKYGAEELAGSFVFPAENSGRVEANSTKRLQEILAERRASLTPAKKQKMQLMQLRFQIEDYLKEKTFNRQKTFGFFLKSYVTIINKKSNEFAREIDIKPAELSQYINDHRTPPKPVIIRLEIHSQNIIPAIHWYKLAENKKLHELMNDKSLRREQKKYVKKEVV